MSEAETLFDDCISEANKIRPEEALDRIFHHRDYGRFLLESKRHDRAEEQLLITFEGCRTILGIEHRFTQESIEFLANLYSSWGKPEEEEKYRAMLVFDSSYDGQ